MLLFCSLTPPHTHTLTHAHALTHVHTHTHSMHTHTDTHTQVDKMLILQEKHEFLISSVQQIDYLIHSYNLDLFLVSSH